MLLAYLDETGETGAFISPDHPKFNTSAAFGYAGFVIPDANARWIAGQFAEAKKTLFATEIEAAGAHPGRWERKGAQIFRPSTPQQFPQQLRVFAGLVRSIRRNGGQLFYYADEKPLGTPKQTQLDVVARETSAMQETLNRLARHANTHDENILVMIDQINEKTRLDRLPRMYSHILGRAAEWPEMRRIIEPPMHIDSQLSSNIQLADWVAACVTRAIDYQLVEHSQHGWITHSRALDAVRGSFTFESKLHLYERSVDDIMHSRVFDTHRPLYPVVDGHRISAHMPLDVQRKLRAAVSRRRTP